MTTIKIKNKQSLISRKLKNKISKIKICGFTLIELLVVISIIGILAALGIASYSRAEKNTRDAQRMSDLGQYRIALESYAAANNMVYPVSVGDISSLCTKAISGVTFATTYLSGDCLKDVLAGSYTYFSSNGTAYTLYAQLENPDNTYYFFICSIGRSGKKKLVTPSAICPTLP